MDYQRVLTPSFAPIRRYADQLGDELRAEYIPFVLGEERVLRPEFTTGVCRLFAEDPSLASASSPQRLNYVGQTFRVQSGESLFPYEKRQLGGEIFGLSAPDGEVEAIRALAELSDAVGGRGWQVALGHGGLLEAALLARGASELQAIRVRRDLHRSKRHARRLHAGDAVLAEVLPRLFAARSRRVGLDLAGLALADGDEAADLVALEARVVRAEWRAAGLPDEAIEVVDRLREARGSLAFVRRWLSEAAGEKAASEALASLAAVLDETGDSVRARGATDGGLTVFIDATATRDIGYYDGVLFDVYGPREGQPLGGGGRYDGLVEAVCGPTYARPAIGFALDLLRVSDVVADGGVLQ